MYEKNELLWAEWPNDSLIQTFTVVEPGSNCFVFYTTLRKLQRHCEPTPLEGVWVVF